MFTDTTFRIKVLAFLTAVLRVEAAPALMHGPMFPLLTHATETSDLISLPSKYKALVESGYVLPGPAYEHSSTSSSTTRSSTTLSSTPTTAGSITYTPTSGTVSSTPRTGGDLTISFINSHTADLSTAHAQGTPGPAAVIGHVANGILPKGATDWYAVPTGYNGNVAFVEAGEGRAIVGDESLFEASFVQQGGSANAFIDIDVSYVTGFSVPIVCSCDNLGVVTGCNKNLWDMSVCPLNNGLGSCKNPQRDADTDDAQPSAFFAPCQHAAFTVPRDPGANINNVCQSGTVTCCIGAACPVNPHYA